MYVDSGINFEKHFVPVEAIQYFENLHLFDVGQFSRVVLFYGLIFSKYFSREIFAKNDSLLTFITAAKKIRRFFPPLFDTEGARRHK
jgi:hypothetical protein